MKKKFNFVSVSLLILIGLMNEAQAIPMFGKQTGLDCTACHLQHMPKLNSAGRKFAASGMTVSKMLRDTNSTGMDINPSVMVKSMYEETWDKPSATGLIKEVRTTDGDWAVPKTASLFLGGKVSDNVGAIINLSYKDIESNTIAGKVVYAKEVSEGYLGATVYSSADFGPFSGMENYNSGLYKPLRTFDIKKLSNAFQASEIGTGAATGAQIYYDADKLFTGNDHIFGTVGIYAPAQDNVDMDLSDNAFPFARMAYEYPLGDFNFILGAFGIVGGSTVSYTQPLHIERETYGMDFQVEGIIAEKSVSLILSKVLKNKVTYTGRGSNLLDPAEYSNLDNKAFSVEGEINLTPEFGLKAAYMTFDDLYNYPNSVVGNKPNSDYQANHLNVQDIDRAITIGADYSFQLYFPMKISIEHSWAKPVLDRVQDYRDFLVSWNILY